MDRDDDQMEARIYAEGDEVERQRRRQRLVAAMMSLLMPQAQQMPQQGMPQMGQGMPMGMPPQGGPFR